jgi:hypothetical protein
MIAADASAEARPIGGNVKSAERYRRNFSVRLAVRQQGKIPENHLLIRHAGRATACIGQACVHAALETRKGERRGGQTHGAMQKPDR